MSRVDERALRELVGVLAAEEDPAPELAPAAIALATEALRVAAEAWPQRRRCESAVVMPLATQAVLTSSERTATALQLIMQLMPALELLLYERADSPFSAEPLRPGETGQARGSRLTRSAAAALHALVATHIDGSSPLLVAKVQQLRDVTIRTDGDQ